jgi:hypothetical protein
LRLAALPEVICQVVNAVGCGFLLDLSHARLAANQRNVNAKDYIRALPISRTREIHITGLQRFEGKWLNLAQQAGVDADTIQWFSGQLIDHLPMTDADWEFLAWFIEQRSGDVWGHPWITAFEYGGIGWLFGAVAKKDVLLAQVPRLYEMVKQLQPEP